MGTEPGLEIRLLGGFDAHVGARGVPSTVWRQRRAAAIVKLLALEPGHRLHREQLGLEQVGALPGVFLVRDGESLVLGPLTRHLRNAPPGSMPVTSCRMIPMRSGPQLNCCNEPNSHARSRSHRPSLELILKVGLPSTAHVSPRHA